MSHYKLVPVGLLKDWHKQINTIAVEVAFNVADEMEALLSAAPAVQGEPVGRVKTVGGYPDESEHTIEWLCKYKDLKDGDLLYASPQPVEQRLSDDSAAVRLDKQCREAVAAALGFVRGGDYAWSYLLQQIKEIASAEQKPEQNVPSLDEALRQYRNNDGSGLVFGYDMETAQRVVADLVDALQSVLEFGNDTNTNRGAWAVGKAHKAIANHRRGDPPMTTNKKKTINYVVTTQGNSGIKHMLRSAKY